jgi:hypothetical protein
MQPSPAEQVRLDEERNMFRLHPLRIDTLSEPVIVINAAAVQAGNLGFHPLDRVRVMGVETRQKRRRPYRQAVKGGASRYKGENRKG